MGGPPILRSCRSPIYIYTQYIYIYIFYIHMHVVVFVKVVFFGGRGVLKVRVDRICAARGGTISELLPCSALKPETLNPKPLMKPSKLS